MLNETIMEILAKEGPATFATEGTDGPHLAATWNSYVLVAGTHELLIPAGGFHETEQNVNAGSSLQMILGSKEVDGIHGSGAGYVLKGSAQFETTGQRFDLVKSKFPWARAVMVFQPKVVKQLI